MIKLDDYRGGFTSDLHPFYKEGSSINDYINCYSQNGEEGVLEKIFETLNITKGKFVNAGADDINDHSTVRKLISFYGWSGLFIEPNGEMLKKGRENLSEDDRINDAEFDFHTGFVSTKKDDERINNIISKYYDDKTIFDLLTLHIDSYEYWVLEDFLKGDYDSKVILVGYNSSRPDSVTSPKDCDPKIGHNTVTDNFYSATGSALNKLANKYNYQLISICKPNNLIFIKKDLNKNLFEEYSDLKVDDYYWNSTDWYNKVGLQPRNEIDSGWIEV